MMTDKIAAAGIGTAGIGLTAAILQGSLEQIGYLLANPEVVREEGIKLNLDQSKIDDTIALMGIVFISTQGWAAWRLLQSPTASRLAQESVELMAESIALGKVSLENEERMRLSLMALDAAKEAQGITQVKVQAMEILYNESEVMEVARARMINDATAPTIQAMDASIDVIQSSGNMIIALEAQGLEMVGQGVATVADRERVIQMAGNMLDLPEMMGLEPSDLLADMTDNLYEVLSTPDLPPFEYELAFDVYGNGIDTIIEDMGADILDNVASINERAIAAGFPVPLTIETPLGEMNTIMEQFADDLRAITQTQMDDVIFAEFKVDVAFLDQQIVGFINADIQMTTDAVLHTTDALDTATTWDELRLGMRSAVNDYETFMPYYDGDIEIKQTLYRKQATATMFTSQEQASKAKLAEKLASRASLKSGIAKWIGRGLGIDFVIWIATLSLDLGFNLTDMTEGEQIELMNHFAISGVGLGDVAIEPVGGFSPLGEYVIEPILNWLYTFPVVKSFIDDSWDAIILAAQQLPKYDEFIAWVLDEYIVSIDIEVSWYLIGSILSAGSLDGTALWILSNPDYFIAVFALALAAKILYVEVFAPLASSFASPASSS